MAWGWTEKARNFKFLIFLCLYLHFKKVHTKFTFCRIDPCVRGQPMLPFWKLADETQISKPPEPTMNHNSIKWLVLLPLRAELLFTLQYEIPCTLCNIFYIFSGPNQQTASHFLKNSGGIWLFRVVQSDRIQTNYPENNKHKHKQNWNRVISNKKIKFYIT